MASPQPKRANGDEAPTELLAYQALAVAACYSDEWQVSSPLLIVVPCSLRRQWAEELESAFPQLNPAQLHTIKTTTSGNEDLAEARVVITSFRLMAMMGKGFWERKWGMVIVDESSRMRTSRMFSKTSKETKACWSTIRRVRRALLVRAASPSLPRLPVLPALCAAFCTASALPDRLSADSAVCSRAAFGHAD